MREQASRALARALVASILAVGIAIAGQDRIVERILPLFQTWLLIVDDTYRTLDLSLGEGPGGRGERVVRRIATPLDIRVEGTRVTRPARGILVANEAAAGIVLQPLVLALPLLLAWPWRRRRELALRLAAAAILLPLVLLLDVPMMLYGFAWLDELRVADPERFSPLVTWADAMNAGGRFVLTAFAVAASLSLGRAAAAPRASAR